MLPIILKIYLENKINLSIKIITDFEKQEKKTYKKKLKEILYLIKYYKEILVPYKLKTTTVLLSSLFKTNFNIAKTYKST